MVRNKKKTDFTRIGLWYTYLCLFLRWFIGTIYTIYIVANVVDIMNFHIHHVSVVVRSDLKTNLSIGSTGKNGRSFVPLRKVPDSFYLPCSIFIERRNMEKGCHILSGATQSSRFILDTVQKSLRGLAGDDLSSILRVPFPQTKSRKPISTLSLFP